MDGASADLRTRLEDGLPRAAFREVEPRYLEEPRGRWRGQARLVVAPGSTEEVSGVVRACADLGVPIVPYGGGTSLVGGQVMTKGPPPLLLSTERMTAIRGVWPAEDALVAEAGATLEDVRAAAAECGRLFPLWYASAGTAQIGGVLSTNGGGVNVLRYGTARDLCLGLEAVLADGAVWHGLKRLRKDNTGYDLRHLLIGAEGTLGVITAATLRLVPRPARVGAGLMTVPGPGAALDLFTRAQQVAGEAISAFELISGVGLDFIAETGFELRRPFAERPDWMVLVELGMGERNDPDACLETIFAAGAEAGLVTDGVVAQSEGQRQEFWRIRETIPEANKRVGAVMSHDISLPRSAIPDFLDRGRGAIARVGAFRINAFGHLGDGNLHYNVFPPEGVARGDVAHHGAEVMRVVHDLVDEMGGSVSAEHGIGRMKVPELERYGDPAGLAAMRAIKAALDPAGIFNPGAVLRVRG